MVISRSANGQDIMQFNRNDVDSNIALLNIRKTGTIGFSSISQCYATTNKDENHACAEMGINTTK